MTTTLQIVHTMNVGNRKRKARKVLALVNSVAVLLALFSTYCFVFQPMMLVPNLPQTKNENTFETLQVRLEDHIHKEKEEDESVDYIMDDDDDDFVGGSTTGGNETTRTLSFWKSLTNGAFGKVEQEKKKIRALRTRAAKPP